MPVNRAIGRLPRRLRDLHQLPRTWASKARLAELTKPKPRPAR